MVILLKAGPVPASQPFQAQLHAGAVVEVGRAAGQIAVRAEVAAEALRGRVERVLDRPLRAAEESVRSVVRVDRAVEQPAEGVDAVAAERRARVTVVVEDAARQALRPGIAEVLLELLAVRARERAGGRDLRARGSGEKEQGKEQVDAVVQHGILADEVSSAERPCVPG